MSTDIFQATTSSSSTSESRSSDPYARLSPWQIYLAISLPLTFVTLLTWAAFHLWEKRQERIKKQALEDARIPV